MRTKTLLLTAVLSAAGILSSSAQVFSVNAVGYVNVQIPAGFSMIANPLKATANTLGALIPTAPDGTTVWKFNPTTGTFTSATFDALDNAWGPNPNIGVEPGEGLIIRAAAAFQNTFVGEVLQGALSTAMPSGYSIVSSKVPQEGRVDTVLAFPGVDGASISRFDNAANRYVSSTFDGIDNAWTPSTPSPRVGESFWARMPAATTWSRNFNINQ